MNPRRGTEGTRELSIIEPLQIVTEAFSNVVGSVADFLVKPGEKEREYFTHKEKNQKDRGNDQNF